MRKFFKQALKTILAIIALVIIVVALFFVFGGANKTLQTVTKRKVVNQRERHHVQYLFTIDSCKFYKFVDPETGKIGHILTCPCGANKIIE